jgi:SAM-dependent methyltransferase
MSRRILRRIKSAFFHSEFLYRLSLQWKYGRPVQEANPSFFPAEFPNRVLESRAAWQEATQYGRRLHLPLHRSDEKNWDHLAAVHAIVQSLPRSARVLDAGAEFYSNVLPALFVYGYRNLYGINLSFVDPARRGPIRYLPGDITRTEFSDGSFDAVTCMSVIEHGVPLHAYFREMFRVLKPGGLLITSTDYYPEPIDTGDRMAHGAPIKIFCKQEVEGMIRDAQTCGFELTGEIDLDHKTRAVRWDEYDLEFTFLIFTLRKPLSSGISA